MMWRLMGRDIALVILLAGVVAFGVSWGVNRTTGSDEGIPLTVPQVSATERETANLADVVILPTISTQGRVVEQDDGFVMQASISPAELAYQLMDEPTGVRGTIVGGPAGFDCAWEGMQRAERGMAMTCRIPDDVRVVDGLAGILVLETSEPVKTQGLPASAVVGTNQMGQVVVLDGDGSTEVRDVELGASDGFNIEITEGLNADETVLLYPVQYDLVRPAA